MVSADSVVSIAVALAAIAASSGDAKKAAAACLGAGGFGVLVFLLKDGVKKAVELLQTMLEEL